MTYDEDGGVEVASFQITGLKAVVAVVAIVAIGGWYWWSGTTAKPAPPEVHEPLKMWIAADYTSSAFSNVETGGGLGMTDKEKAKVDLAMRQMVKPEDVTLKNVQIRGDHEDDAVVRAEVLIKGGPAPDGKTVRYYEVRWRSLDRQWDVMFEVDELKWKMSAW